MTFHIIFSTTLAAILFHLWCTRIERFTPGRIVEVFLLYLLCIQWGFGAAYVHIQDITLHDNLSPGNAGSVLFYDLAMPLVGCILFFLHYRLGGIRQQLRGSG